MMWGEYLCRGAAPLVHCSTPSQDDRAFEKLIGRMEQAMQHLGLSKFSSSVAVQFITGKLQSGEQHKVQHAMQYLLDLLNNKFSSGRDNCNTSTNRCPQLIPGLTAKPFWDTAQLPWVSQLEEAYDQIKKEFLELKQMPNRKVSSGFQHYRSPKQHGVDSAGAPETNIAADTGPGDSMFLGESATDKGHWNVCYFYLHGVDFSKNRERCPLTTAEINAVPRQYQHALFSALAPDTHVKPHCGPTNKKLRCHLPLHIPAANTGADADGNAGGAPPSAWLRVGDQYCALEDGKCVVFDDSFEHEACNPSLTEPRAVLIVDVWHPDLSDVEVKFFDFINKAQIKAAQRMSAALARQQRGTEGQTQEGDQAGHIKDQGLEGAREDFFHVIQAAKEQGIAEGDHGNIWAHP